MPFFHDTHVHHDGGHTDIHADHDMSGHMHNNHTIPAVSFSHDFAHGHIGHHDFAHGHIGHHDPVHGHIGHHDPVHGHIGHHDPVHGHIGHHDPVHGDLDSHIHHNWIVVQHSPIVHHNVTMGISHAFPSPFPMPHLPQMPSMPHIPQIDIRNTVGCGGEVHYIPGGATGGQIDCRDTFSLTIGGKH